MTDHDAIAAKVRQDREAGTPGVWDAAIESGCHAIVAAILPDGANIIALIGNSLETPERETMRFANARRIAALPDLEAAYLDLYDEVQRLRADKRLIIDERDNTFALMLARAEKAEAERDRLRAVLTNGVNAYDATNFMRTADMHPDECGCLRCAMDAARAALKGDSDE